MFQKSLFWISGMRNSRFSSLLRCGFDRVVVVLFFRCSVSPRQRLCCSGRLFNKCNKKCNKNLIRYELLKPWVFSKNQNISLPLNFTQKSEETFFENFKISRQKGSSHSSIKSLSNEISNIIEIESFTKSQQKQKVIGLFSNDYSRYENRLIDF